MNHMNNAQGFSISNLMADAAERLSALGPLPKGGIVKVPPMECPVGAIALRVVESGGAYWRCTAMLAVTLNRDIIIQAEHTGRDLQNPRDEWERAHWTRTQRGYSIAPTTGQHCNFTGIPKPAKLRTLLMVPVLPTGSSDPDEVYVPYLCKLDGQAVPLLDELGLDSHSRQLFEKASNALITELMDLAATAEAAAEMVPAKRKKVRTPQLGNTAGIRMQRQHGMPMGLREEQDALVNRNIAEAKDEYDMANRTLEQIVAEHGGPPVASVPPPLLDVEVDAYLDETCPLPVEQLVGAGVDDDEGPTMGGWVNGVWQDSLPAGAPAFEGWREDRL
jgi:hypothetical protein